MSVVVTVAQLKGGVGKTTLAVALAAELAKRNGSCALIDADPQRSAVQWALPGRLPCPVYAMPLEDMPVEEWVRQTRTVAAEYVVVDSAPNAKTVIAPIAISNLTVLPCTPSGLDLEGMGRTLAFFGTVHSRWPEKRCVIVPNRVDGRTLEGRQFMEELARFGPKVSPSVGNRIAFVRAFASGQSIADFEPSGVAAYEVGRLCEFLCGELRS
jgi:chromosome partitioning protein